MKKRQILLFAIFCFLLFPLALTAFLHDAKASPVVLNMDLPPTDAGQYWTRGACCASVSGGTLTISTDPSFGSSNSWFLYFLVDPTADWVQNADNHRGWIVETRMQVDPSSVNLPNNTNIGIWIDDGVYRTMVGLDTDKVFVEGAERVEVLFDTTNGFHTYRIEGLKNSFKVFIDGFLAIDYQGAQTASVGFPNLAFGDGNGLYYSRSYWDYFWYDTKPGTFTTGKWIGTSATNATNSFPFQRKSFHANGLFWVFYSDGTDMVFNTSPVGINWSAPTTVRPSTSGEQSSVWFDGSFVHYAYASGLTGAPVVYNRGIPNADGTVTWGEEQGAVPGIKGVTYNVPCIALDSEGYPWIGYRKVDKSGNKFPAITKPSRNDGWWNGIADTAAGFPYNLETWTAAYWVVAPIPLTDGKMLAIFSSHGHYIRAKSWNGTAWSGLVQSAGLDHTQNAVTSCFFSAVAEGDDVHLVFLDSNGIRYARYTYTFNRWHFDPLNTGKLNPEPVIQSGVTDSSAPVLSIDSLGDLHLFWAGKPIDNHIFYRHYTAGKWDSTFSDWIDENVEELTSNASLSISYKAENGYCLFYLTKHSPPYNVKFGGFPYTVPSGIMTGTSTTGGAISYSFQRKGFFNYGRFWAFYADGTNMVFKMSKHGDTWSDSTIVRPAAFGGQFSIWADIVNVYYAYASGIAGAPVLFRKGLPNFDGTIDWSPEQVAVPGIPGITYSVPFICVDSLGYPWIGYRRVDSLGNKFPAITKSSRSDGIWNGYIDTAPGFPFNLELWTAAYWFVTPIPLADGKMLAIYASHGHYIRAKTWHGGVWGQMVITKNVVTGNFLSAVSQYPFPGNDAHIVYLNDNIIRYVKYVFSANAFVTEEVVQGGVTLNSAPVLSYGWRGDLDLFWAGAPIENHIFYKRNSGGVWQSAYVDYIDENMEELTSNDALSSLYDSGNGSGLISLTKEGSPFNVKFNPGF